MALGNKTDLAKGAAVALLVAATCAEAGSAMAQRQKTPGPAVFSCLPRVVGPGDVLVIRKNISELKELMVRQPKSNVPRMLVLGSPEPGMRMLMSSETFAHAREVKIPVASLTGLAWSAGARQEKVFMAYGIYRFTAADTLESDAGDSLSCRVEYRPGKA